MQRNEPPHGRQSLYSSLTCAALVLGLLAAAALARADSLEAGFEQPPDSAKPQTWWHWMNGNITREGITADLEAMKRVGIYRAEIFNVDCGIPAGPVKFMSPEWFALMKFAAQEAQRLGLKLCIMDCAGWSNSGGPWNTPEHGMLDVTSSRQQVTGPAHFSGLLPQPPTKLEFYHDIAVLAFPVPGGKTAASGQVIPCASIVDLSSRLQADGRLEWDVPAGSWTILRLGYTPTGRQNHPAPAEGTGLECDKFSPEALDAHWAGFVQKVLDELGPLAGRGKTLDNVLIDSYEVGRQDWTPRFRAEFQSRRGYDPLLYLPALAGSVVENSAVTARFQWDMHRTEADLFADSYYGHFQVLCHEHGLKASFEPYTGPFESLQCGKGADIPMGEFWVGHPPDRSVKLAASIGHIYGRRIIGAESFTGAPAPTHGRWLDDPYSLKALGDQVFCQGVNRFIFHRYAMQPWTNRWPGMTMGKWGTHLDRTCTWWEQGRAWMDYLTRCQFLLQQGSFVADAAYFDGETAPAEFPVCKPALPAGYDYDGLSAGVLRQATVSQGRLVLPSGMSYRLLILPPSQRTMTPGLLRKLDDLVKEGLTLVGPRPQASPSLQDYPACDAAVKSLAAQMWGECDGQRVTEHRYGRGRVVWGRSLARVLAELKLQPDFESPDRTGARLDFIHRRDGEAEIYFVSNQRHQYQSAECTFRVSGKRPELWDPETGRIEPAPVWHEEAGRTVVPLSFSPAGSVFVVFRSQAPAEHLVGLERSGPQPKAPRHKRHSLRILKAVYGPPPGELKAKARQNPRDITATVSDLVAQGKLRLAVGNELAGGDPAPYVRKELRVEFRLGDRTQTREANEGKTLELPAGAQVTQALYGNFDPRRTRPAGNVDLTGKLAALVEHGELRALIDDHLAGGDPAPGLTKQLRVEYSVDGVRKRTVVGQNELLSLPESDQPLGAPPLFSFAQGREGQARLLAWAPGKFTLRWASGRKAKAPCRSVPAPRQVRGAWELSFPPGWGAPAHVTLDPLQSWTENSDSGVKYFSGTVTYEKELDIPAAWITPTRVVCLDLGAVKNLAEVSLNGQPLGILWKPPFSMDITAAARPGKNLLQVKVTNLWPNRLIGDEQLPPDCEWDGEKLARWPVWLLAGKPSPTGRLTFTTWHHWSKDDALLPSGLLGPVTLRCAVTVTLR